MNKNHEKQKKQTVGEGWNPRKGQLLETPSTLSKVKLQAYAMAHITPT